MSKNSIKQKCGTTTWFQKAGKQTQQSTFQYIDWRGLSFSRIPDPACPTIDCVSHRTTIRDEAIISALAEQLKRKLKWQNQGFSTATYSKNAHTKKALSLGTIGRYVCAFAKQWIDKAVGFLVQLQIVDSPAMVELCSSKTRAISELTLRVKTKSDVLLDSSPYPSSRTEPVKNHT